MKYLHFLVVICLFASCEIPNPDGTISGEGSEAIQELLQGFKELSTEAQELARPNKVEVWVDKLIVKAQPGKDMPTITRLDEGTVVEYLYQRTLRKSNFTLRGQAYSQPWILVKLNDGQMGWVHEGGVRFVQPELDELFGNLNPNNSTSTRGVTPRNANTTVSQWLVEPGKYVGKIRLNTSESEVIQLYGSSNVTRGSVSSSGVKAEPCTIVFPNTENEIQITWYDDTRTKVKAVYFQKANSKWHTLKGLYVGMNMLDVTKVNKSPISFYGFDWEYSGTVSSWKNGVLRHQSKFFYVVLAPMGTDKATYSKFKGESVFSSNTEGVDKLNLHVSKLVVYLD